MEPEVSLPHSQVPATCPYPVHTSTSNFLKIHLNVIHPFKPGSPQWSLSSRFPYQNPEHASSSLIRATRPAHLILLDFITRTILGDEYIKLSSSLYRFLYSPLTSSLLGPNTLLNTLFSNTLSLRSSLSVSDQVSNLAIHCKKYSKLILFVTYLFGERYFDSENLLQL